MLVDCHHARVEGVAALRNTRSVCFASTSSLASIRHLHHVHLALLNYLFLQSPLLCICCTRGFIVSCANRRTDLLDLLILGEYLIISYDLVATYHCVDAGYYDTAPLLHSRASLKVSKS